MKSYSIEQLSQPETYKIDKELFGLARTIATERFPSNKTAMLTYRDEIVAGRHPHEVKKYMIKIVQKQVEAFEKRCADIEIAKALIVPDNVTLTVNEDNDMITIQANWDGYDLGPRLHRLGGRFDYDQKAWRLPVSAASSLKRVFSNWIKSQGEKAKAEAEAKAE